MNDFSFIANAHPNFIDDLYQKYQNDPESIEESWKTFFKGFDFASNGNGSTYTNGTASNSNGTTTGFDIVKELRVLSLIMAYRNRGHLLSTTNPIRTRRDRRPNLNIEDFSLSEADLDLNFYVGTEIGLAPNTSLRNIIKRLKEIYCGNIGFEFNHIQNRDKRRWIRTRIEQHIAEGGYGLSVEKKKRILEKLNGAVIFERFLHTKYVGQKRFSLEGGESTIAALDAIINAGAEDRVEEVIIGMAHRGRLNVLVNTIGKTYADVFNEFEGNVVLDQIYGDGDVKYHLGFSSQMKTLSGKEVHLRLVPNPSHLESVDPVVEGYARAKADLLYQSDYDKILPILIHGDAAVAGQGVVYETLQMSTRRLLYRWNSSFCD